MTILEKIIAFKKKEVKNNKLLYPIAQLEQTIAFEREIYSLKQSLLSGKASGIIAEYKRKSPSKGIINEIAKIEDVTQAYCKAGVSGLSVLTDKEFFGGDRNDLITARKYNQCPILRKDFMIDEHQIIEAKALGADVILLIAAVLETKQLKNLAKLAKSLKLDVLMEIHTKSELEKANEYIDIIGVNNRNLKDFTVDIERSIVLSSFIPEDFVKISESGISNPENINKLKPHGFKGFLIGENFMKTNNPGVACADFIANLNNDQ